MLTLTDSAIGRLKELLAEEDSGTKLRIFVQGGGCSGMQYGFTFDEEQNEDDFEIPCGDIAVLVDAMSSQYLTGAEVDYKEDIMGASFAINNPNAETSCGCGSSFSPAQPKVA